MYMRGPDSDGYYCHENVGFGFRRLAIIDLESGDQPLCNEDGSIWLVMNGEVYNFIELRSELQSKGHIFQTKSDAEVILHLYEEYGNECVQHLNGMFAFAIHDQIRGKILLGRDRLGIKPLYYKKNGQQIVFGSDARAVVQSSSPEINEESFLAYLSFAYTADESIFRGVHKLPPATLLEINGDSHQFHPYWKLEGISSQDYSVPVAQDQLLELLENAINIQLRSDVPLGVFLSGGVDSSAVVALAAEALNVPVSTYSIEYTEKNGEDPRYAEQVSKQYKTHHTRLVLGPNEAEEGLDALLHMLDEPIADSAIIATYALSKRAREDGVKVLLSGAGGDEIFGGYSRHLRTRYFSRHWLRDILLNRSGRYFSKVLERMNPGLHSRIGNRSLNYTAQISGADYSVIQKLLNENQYERLVGHVAAEYGSINRDEPVIGFEYARMRNDLEGYLVNNILALTDKATMAASVEARVPLLDHKLVEFAFALRPSVNIANGVSKGLFKKALSGKLSHDLLHRKKEGFNAPVKQWVTGNSGEIMKQNLLGEPSKVLEEFIDLDKLRNVLSDEQYAHSGFETIFSLYIFNRWWNANFS